MVPIKLHRIDFLTKEDFTYGKIPSRMMYLRDIPERNMLESYTAWQRLKQVQEYKPLIYTDIYRSPASSAEAYARKVGVAKPGYSGHNYGISVDVAVEASMRRHKITYTQLCNIMIVYGWTPYQGKVSSYKRGKEDWHFNFIGEWSYSANDNNNKVKPGADQVNTWILQNYHFEDDMKYIQVCLKKLKFYQGEIDGLKGPLTSNGIKKFQQAWFPKTLPTTGKLDNLTVRLVNIIATDVVDEHGTLII